MRRRPFILFFSLLLIFFLVCWPAYYMRYKKDVDIVPQSEREYQGLITIMDFPHPSENDPTGFSWIKTETARFQKLHPGVVIDFVPLNYSDGYARLESSVRTGVYPDIAPVGGDYWYISKDILQPLNEYIDDTRVYKQGVIEEVSKDDNIYGLPWAITSDVVFINKDLLSKLKNGEDNTATGFNDMLAVLEKKNEASKGNKAYAMGGYIGMDDYTLLPFLFKNGKIYNDEGEPEFNKIKHGYEFFCDLSNRGLLTENFGTDNKNNAWNNFIEDDTIVCIPYNVSGTRKLKELSDSKFAAYHYPSDIKSVKKVYAYSVFKQKDPKKTEMAIKFIKQITSEDKQTELKKFNLIPVFKSQSDLYRGDKAMEKIIDISNDAKYLPRNEHFEMLDEIIKTHLRQVVLGAEKPDEAAEKTKREYNECISALHKSKADR